MRTVEESVMETRIAPFLMFEGRAEEAIQFYIEHIPDSHIVNITKFGPAGPGPEGSVMVATFVINGLTVMCSDSFISHDFSFTPSISLFVTCESEKELLRLSTVLGQQGDVLMPADNYGFSTLFTWLNDQFGVSWQLNCP